jgi:hypothetical protein
VHAGFWCGSLRERDHLEDIDVDGMTMFQWFLKWDGCTDCFLLPQDRDKWLDAVDAVMNFRVPSNSGIFRLPEDLLVFKKGCNHLGTLSRAVDASR